jgi:hypothetical protein
MQGSAWRYNVAFLTQGKHGEVTKIHMQPSLPMAEP